MAGLIVEAVPAERALPLSYDTAFHAKLPTCLMCWWNLSKLRGVVANS